MLTRAQIQRIAQRHRIGVQAQERDYIQHLLLLLLYGESQLLTFKGGTALRIIYNGNRYSEDLDFNGPADMPMLERLWTGVLDGLRDFGIAAEIRNDWQSAVGYSFDISYHGPLYDGRDRTKGKVRVDTSVRQEEVDTQRELVSSEYDDVRPFVITAITAEHLLAEKVRAFLVRSKARDVYDIWLLATKGVQLDRSLLARKLELYDIPLTESLINEALKEAQADWERDLRPLLPQMVAWEDAMLKLAPILRVLVS